MDDEQEEETKEVKEPKKEKKKKVVTMAEEDEEEDEEEDIPLSKSVGKIEQFFFYVSVHCPQYTPCATYILQFIGLLLSEFKDSFTVTVRNDQGICLA